MAERNIFIGLGGSGVGTVAALKYKIYANIDDKNPYDLMNRDYKFYFIDTDEADVAKQNAYYRSKFEGGRRQFIDSKNELINLGMVNPHAVYDEAASKQVTERTDVDNTILESCPEEYARILKPYPLKDGAGAFRYNSHIALALMVNNFIEQLKTGIQQLLDTRTAGAEGVTLRYWIVGSCNGGTGSGTFNDVLYLVNMLHKSFRRNEEPKTTLVLYMPRFYINANKGNEKYICNAYASFVEMNGYQEMARSGESKYREMIAQMMYHPVNLSIEEGVAYRPFSSCIPIDVQTENGNSLLTSKAMYSNTAELLYFIHQSQGRDPLASSFKSDADNYLDDVLTTHPLSYLQPMGYVALRKPEAEFENYMNHRLKMDVLTNGLLSPVLDEDELAGTVTELYRSIVYKELFSDEPGSFAQMVNSIVQSQIRRSFSDNLLKEDGKLRNRLPSGISQAAADRVISQFSTAIDDLYEGRTGQLGSSDSDYSKKAVLGRMEDQLWKWIERLVFKRGLVYVEAVLRSLDLRVTQELHRYVNGTGADSTGTLAATLSGILEQLPALCREATEVTITERILNRNTDDIRRYYMQLLEYIKTKGKQELLEMKVDILTELCDGDNGIIGKMRSHISSLQRAAVNFASGPKDDYVKLAQSFENSAWDITTVYLPALGDFVEHGSWKYDHLFSRLYEQVLRPKAETIPGFGKLPMRTCEESKSYSVEGFLYKLVDSNKQKLIAQGYYHEEEGHSYSKIFRKNRWSENPAKVIQDLVTFVEHTYETEYKNEATLQQSWYNKTLYRLFEDLTTEEQEQIKNRLSPQLFYSYKNSVIENGKEFNYIIAPSKQMAEDVFHYREGSTMMRLDLSSSDSVAYMLKAKIGLPLHSYMLYDMVMQGYKEQSDKARYHTHAAWGRCNGDYRKLRMENRVMKELVVFAKYLLVNEFAAMFPDFFYKPVLAAEKDLFKQTPLLIRASSMAFALTDATGIIKDYVALQYDETTYVEYMASSSDLLYSDVYRKFEEDFVTNNHEQAMAMLLNQLAPDADFKHNYMSLKDALIKRLDAFYVKSSREDEKKTLWAVMRLFSEDGELSDYSKFIL